MTQLDIFYLRIYYLSMMAYHLACAAYHGACAQFWRGVLAALCGIQWALERLDSLTDV